MKKLFLIAATAMLLGGAGSVSAKPMHHHGVPAKSHPMHARHHAKGCHGHMMHRAHGKAGMCSMSGMQGMGGKGNAGHGDGQGMRGSSHMMGGDHPAGGGMTMPNPAPSPKH
ncbi:hypothetical protein [Novosphingobium sp.]|uniref:hypothetical protein n=1 Tax=Novosphingobium sp. TaxID=1874826 RepID=UPI002632D96A|nr:hypothetical protein [Novosphingobium sp.]